jgi:hypothetical protein
MASSPKSPVSGFRSPLPPEAPKESAVSRVVSHHFPFPLLLPQSTLADNQQLFIAPLVFVSFLLSLALVDSRNNSRRTHSHSPSRAPPTFLGHTKEFLHSLVYKPTSASPYAYIKSPNSQASLRNGAGKAKENEPWHWNTKQRHMMKAEMDDAFRVRKWVVVFLVAFGVASTVGGVAVLRWGIYVWKN